PSSRPSAPLPGGWTGCWCARPGSSRTTSRCCTTSTSRRGRWRRRPGWASGEPSRSTTTPASWPYWPAWCARRRREWAAVSAPRRVAVVGGGIAGLAAARELAVGGAEVVVYEAADRLGGKIETSEVGGRPV